VPLVNPRDEITSQPFRAGSGAELVIHRSTSAGNRKDIEMRPLSTPSSFLIAMFSLASLPASMGAQSENLTATKATNQSVDVLRAGPEASETQCCNSVVSKGQPILQPGTLREPGQAPIKLWGMPRIPTDAPTANRKSWISARPGSLPLAVAVQPDLTQKYGTNPGVLQVYFRRRP
jgi:hypothetical protein